MRGGFSPLGLLGKLLGLPTGIFRVSPPHRLLIGGLMHTALISDDRDLVSVA